MSVASTARPLRLRIEGAAKRYGGVRALKGVELSVRPGEIHALLGENGAGKSTLMKVLAGAVQPDVGRMWIDGEPYAPKTPGEARDAGVAMIYQELNLCPHLSVFDNVMLGRPGSRREARARLTEVLAMLGVTGFDGGTIVGTLGPGDRQLVEIARALHTEAQVIVFDEPTSSLSGPDTERLIRIVRDLSERGVSIIWISHFLDEVTEVAERFSVLRDGESVAGGREVALATTDHMVALMAGRAVEDIYPRSSRTPGPTKLRADGLAGDRGPVHAGFTLASGEILGVFGLVGAGRTEMLRVLFGLDPCKSGCAHLDGRAISPLSPGRWLRAGVGLLSEDRAHEGLGVDLSIADNVVLSSARRVATGGVVLTENAKEEAAAPWMSALSIKASGPHQPVKALSGGNQQKVAIARLLADGAEVFLLDEPTRGIDVGARVEVYALLDRLAVEGKAILIVSSHLPELLGICDRMAVMHRGELGPARRIEDWTEQDALDEAMRGSARFAASSVKGRGPSSHE
ncbi:MAG: sugar ABC transporter ATP-binding protein [Planctomycetota bacterium]